MKIKKMLSVVLAISVLAMVFTALSVSAAPVTLLAKSAGTAPTIDGAVTDVIWTDGFQNFNDATSGNQYKYAWDNTYLYLTVKVKDSTPFSNATKVFSGETGAAAGALNPFEYDCVEFYFSPTNNMSTFTGNDVQFIYTYQTDGTPALRVGSGSSNQKTRYNADLYDNSIAKCSTTTDGWILETAMRWDELLAYKTVSTDADSDLLTADKAKLFSVGLAVNDANSNPDTSVYNRAGVCNWNSFENSDSLKLSAQSAACANDNFDISKINNLEWEGYYNLALTDIKNDGKAYEMREILKDNIDLTSATIDVSYSYTSGVIWQEDGWHDNDYLTDGVVPIGYYCTGGYIEKRAAESLNPDLPMTDIDITVTLPVAVYMDRIDLWGVYKEGVNEPENPDDKQQNGGTVRGMPLAYTFEVSNNGTDFTQVAESDTGTYTELKVDNKFTFDNQEVKVIKLHITRLSDNFETITHVENGPTYEAYLLLLGELAAYNINGRPADVSTSEPSSSEESSSEESSAVSSTPNTSSNTTSNSNNTNNGANSDTQNTASLNSSTANSPVTGEAPVAVVVMAVMLASAGIVVLRKRRTVTM